MSFTSMGSMIAEYYVFFLIAMAIGIVTGWLAESAEGDQGENGGGNNAG